MTVSDSRAAFLNSKRMLISLNLGYFVILLGSTQFILTFTAPARFRPGLLRPVACTPVRRFGPGSNLETKAWYPADSFGLLK
jgi:hypothetical protein